MKEFTQEEKDAWEAFQQHDDLMLKNTYIAEGEEKGMAKGLEQGQLQGKQELIKTMSKNGGSIEEISKLTGIPVKEIEELIK